MQKNDFSPPFSYVCQHVNCLLRRKRYMHRRFLLLLVKLCTFMYMLKGGRQPNLRLGLESVIYCLGTSSTLIICQLVFFKHIFWNWQICDYAGILRELNFFDQKRMWSFSALVSDRHWQWLHISGAKSIPWNHALEFCWEPSTAGGLESVAARLQVSKSRRCIVWAETATWRGGGDGRDLQNRPEI